MSEFESAYAPPSAIVADPTSEIGSDGTPLGAFRAAQWAPFWHRVAAAIIDGLVLAVPAWILTLISSVAFAHGGSFGIMMTAEVLPGYTLGWLYQGWLLSMPRSATLGRRAVGIAIVDGETGERIGFWRGFLHAVVSTVASLLWLLQLLQLVTARRRSPADLTTGTVAVRYRQSGGTVTAVVVAVGLLLMVFFIGIVAAIAIPQYQDYVKRARATQGVAPR